MLDWPEIVASLTRRYPFYSGVSRLANGKLLATVAPPSSKKRWIAAPGGYVRSSLDDFIGRTVFFGGDLDRKLSWLLRRFILPGDCVLDIGANIGIVSLLMSKLVGPSGIVHAFEPNPIVFETLAEAIVFNRRSNIQIHRVALGNQDTTMELHVRWATLEPAHCSKTPRALPGRRTRWPYGDLTAFPSIEEWRSLRSTSKEWNAKFSPAPRGCCGTISRPSYSRPTKLAATPELSGLSIFSVRSDTNCFQFQNALCGCGRTPSSRAVGAILTTSLRSRPSPSECVSGAVASV